MTSAEVEVFARTVRQAGDGLRAALSSGPKTRTIRLLLDPNGEDIAQWLQSAQAASPEIRGAMVQAFFAHVLRLAGYKVVVGTKFDIFARNRLRSFFVEVKSSLNGFKFGSSAELRQLGDYQEASERTRSEIWLATMGLKRKPIQLRSNFRSEMRLRNIGLIEARWVHPDETLLRHMSSIR